MQENIYSQYQVTILMQRYDLDQPLREWVECIAVQLLWPCNSHLYLLVPGLSYIETTSQKIYQIVQFCCVDWIAQNEKKQKQNKKQIRELLIVLRNSYFNMAPTIKTWSFISLWKYTIASYRDANHNPAE